MLTAELCNVLSRAYPRQADSPWWWVLWRRQRQRSWRWHSLICTSGHVMVYMETENLHCCCVAHQAWGGVVCRFTLGSNVAGRSIWVLTLPQSFYVVQLCPFFVIRKCKFVGEIPNSMRSSSMQNGRSVMYGGVRCCPAVERRCIVLSCYSTAIQFLLNLSKNKTVFTVGNGSTKGIVITLTWTKGHYDNKPCVIFIGVTKLQ